MPRCKRKTCLAIIAFLIILSLEMYYWLMPRLLLLTIKQPTDPCKGEVVKETITALNHNKTFVIGSYHDNRQRNVTRVIAVVRYKKVQDLYCWFCCSHDGLPSIVRATVDIHSERLGFPVGTADIVCSEPKHCSPKYMSIHGSSRGKVDELPRFEIKNRAPRDSFSAEFTLCLSVMFGNYNNVLQFIQSIEMYKILGAQKALIYVHNCSQLMEQVLKYYVAEGTVEIIPWPIVSYVNVSSFWYSSRDWHYGKSTVLNDCIYRNMYKSKYVVLNDIDEIILPMKHLSWKTMISSLKDANPETDIFYFENHFFPQSVFSSIDVVNIPFWKTVPGANILQHIYREPNKLWINNFRKMIVNPRKVVQTSVHSILKSYSRTLKVPSDFAILYNCREYNEKEIPEKYLIRDTAIWRFNVSLINKVNEALKKQLLRKSSNSSWNKFLGNIANLF